MLWLAIRAGVDRRLVVLAACGCAEPALVHVPAGEDRPRLAVETARRWARGKATIEEVRSASAAAYAAYAAAYAAYAAAYAAASAAASAAAYAAADAAAAAAAAAAYAASAAADAAVAASAASAAVAADAARSVSLARSADFVRARIPWEVAEAALIGYAQEHGCLVEIKP